MGLLYVRYHHTQLVNMTYQLVRIALSQIYGEEIRSSLSVSPPMTYGLLPFVLLGFISFSPTYRAFIQSMFHLGCKSRALK